MRLLLLLLLLRLLLTIIKLIMAVVGICQGPATSKKVLKDSEDVKLLSLRMQHESKGREKYDKAERYILGCCSGALEYGSIPRS